MICFLNADLISYMNCLGLNPMVSPKDVVRGGASVSNSPGVANSHDSFAVHPPKKASSDIRSDASDTIDAEANVQALRYLNVKNALTHAENWPKIVLGIDKVRNTASVEKHSSAGGVGKASVDVKDKNRKGVVEKESTCAYAPSSQTLYTFQHDDLSPPLQLPPSTLPVNGCSLDPSMSPTGGAKIPNPTTTKAQEELEVVNEAFMLREKFIELFNERLVEIKKDLERKYVRSTVRLRK